MDKTPHVFIAAFIITVIIGGIFYALRNPGSPQSGNRTDGAIPQTATPAAPDSPETFYIYVAAPDGDSLKPVKRKLPLHTAPAEQARELLAALIDRQANPESRVIPEETKILGVYMAENGDAVIDFSHDIREKHSGGVVPELLTIYAIVNTLALNIPEIQTVRILIDGQPSTTLAGHVDISRPLLPNMMITR